MMIMTTKTLRLINVVLLTILVARPAAAQTFICNSIEGYDTHHLTKAYQWQVSSDYGCIDNPAANCDFFISFCQPASACYNQYSACENSSISSNTTIIGDLATTVFFENESGPKGFYAKFPPGPMQNISNTTTCQPSLIIKFECDLNAQWLLPMGNATGSMPQPLEIDTATKTPCETVIRFSYYGACFEGKAPSKPISGGAVFLIILFSSAFVYFAVGIAYNAFVQHRSGINLLPQAQFWLGLPLHAIEGCRFVMGICTRPSTASPARYESV